MPRYIDADAVVKKIDEIQPFAGNKAANAAINLCKDIVRNAPTISPDEVHGVGKWLHTFDEFGTYEKCSCCGKEYYCGPIAPFNYCPNCGAKMIGCANKPWEDWFCADGKRREAIKEAHDAD